MRNEREREYEQACKRLQALIMRGADPYDILQAQAEVNRLARAIKKSAKKAYGKQVDIYDESRRLDRRGERW